MGYLTDIYPSKSARGREVESNEIRGNLELIIEMKLAEYKSNPTKDCYAELSIALLNLHDFHREWIRVEDRIEDDNMEANEVLSQDTAFRELDSDEENQFRKWARDNHKPGGEISSVWHPVVRNECYKMDREARDEGNL